METVNLTTAEAINAEYLAWSDFMESEESERATKSPIAIAEAKNNRAVISINWRGQGKAFMEITRSYNDATQRTRYSTRLIVYEGGTRIKHNKKTLSVVANGDMCWRWNSESMLAIPAIVRNDKAMTQREIEAIERALAGVNNPQNPRWGQNQMTDYVAELRKTLVTMRFTVFERNI